MKKLISLIIALSMLGSLASCKKNSENSSEELLPELTFENETESENTEQTTQENKTENVTTSTSVTEKASVSTDSKTKSTESEKVTEKPKKEPVEQQIISEKQIDTYEMKIQNEYNDSFIDVQEFEIPGYKEKVNQMLSRNMGNYMGQVSIASDGVNIYSIHSGREFEFYYPDGDESKPKIREIRGESVILCYNIESGEIKKLSELTEQTYYESIFYLNGKFIVIKNEAELNYSINILNTETGETEKITSVDYMFVTGARGKFLTFTNFAYSEGNKSANIVVNIETGEKTVFEYEYNEDTLEYIFPFDDGSFGKAIVNPKEKSVHFECDEYSTDISAASVNKVYMTQESATVITHEIFGLGEQYIYSYDFKTMECLKMKINGYGAAFVPVGKNVLGIPSSQSNSGVLSHSYYIIPEIGRAVEMCDVNQDYYTDMCGDSLTLLQQPLKVWNGTDFAIRDNTEKMYLINVRDAK